MQADHGHFWRRSGFQRVLELGLVCVLTVIAIVVMRLPHDFAEPQVPPAEVLPTKALSFFEPTPVPFAAPAGLVSSSPQSMPAPLTLAQQALRKQLQAELAADCPTHRLVLNNRQILEGRIMDETPTAVRFREGFGYTGAIVSSIPRATIRQIDQLPPISIDLSDDEVRLASAFSKFHLIKSGNCSLVTDAPYSDAQHIVELLAGLRQEFEKAFAPLLRAGLTPRPIQVVYFSHEEDYHTYVLQAAPGLVKSAGFYSCTENRLALLDQFGSTQYSQAQRKLTSQEKRLEKSANLEPESRFQASAYLAEMHGAVAGEARAATTRLIRHEGAHQLFHAYGIDSQFPVEPTWLTEGLAQYCEPDEIGAPHEGLTARLVRARDAHTLMTLQKLLNHREAAGFFALKEDKIQIAYAESWALTWFLMQPGRQDGFIEFIKHYRDVPDQHAALQMRGEDVGETLSRALHTDFATLDKQWQEFVDRM